jgi:hypothetical protein
VWIFDILWAFSRKRNELRTKRNWMAMMLVLPLWAWAGPVTTPDEAGLRLLVDQREVEVGSSVKVSIEFRHIGNESVAMGSPQLPALEHFQMGWATSSFTNVAYNQGKEVVTSTNQFDLKAVSEGEQTLGPALLIYQDSHGKKIELRSNQVTIKVVPKTGFSIFGKKKAGAQPPVPTATPEDLSDLKPLMPESHLLLRFLVWGAVALLVLGFVLWKFFLSKPSAPATAPTPGKAAQLRDRWKKLADEDLSSKEFCEGLSSLARECVQYRYGFQAVNFTTEEVLRAMAKVKSTDDERVAVDKILRTCDRVLHADANLTGRDNLRALCSALLPKVPKS